MTASKYAIFAKAVELGSFTNAAKALGCTQSGVSHAINALEDELGLKLILRSRAGLRLTADGERILPAVKAVLAASKELEGTVAAIRGLELGCVRIGAFTSVAVHWLPGMIKSFEQLHPQIEFEEIFDKLLFSTVQFLFSDFSNPFTFHLGNLENVLIFPGRDAGICYYL